AGKPHRTRHAPLAQHAIVRARRRDVEEIPYLRPKAVEIGDGPATQRLVVRERAAAALAGAAHETCDRARRGPVGIGRPEQLAFGHARALPDAQDRCLPRRDGFGAASLAVHAPYEGPAPGRRIPSVMRSEEHTSELQSRQYL